MGSELVNGVRAVTNATLPVATPARVIGDETRSSAAGQHRLPLIEWGQSFNKRDRAGPFASPRGQRRDPVIDRRPASSSLAVSPMPMITATRPRRARNRVAVATAYPLSAAGTLASPS